MVIYRILLLAIYYIQQQFLPRSCFEGVELILRIVLGCEYIKIKSVRTQESMKNLHGRSAILDVHAIDSTDKELESQVMQLA